MCLEYVQILQKNVVHVTAPALLDDMDFQMEDIEGAREKLKQLKSKYLDLMDKIKKDQHKLSAAVAGVASRPESPPIEPNPLRWGIKRTVLGKMVMWPFSSKIDGILDPRDTLHQKET